jgi:hypothetical protein
MQQSKYTEQHFTLAIAQNEKVKDIIVFNPADSSMSVLKITDDKTKLSDLTTKTAISPDGQININDPSSNSIKDDVSQTLFNLTLRYPTLKKDITIFDVVRLGLYAKNLPPNKQVIQEVTSTQLVDDPQLEKTLISFFSDNIIATENTSIQIVNASGVSGIAQRLERVLQYKGANVVSVTTAQKYEKYSQIKYFGNETYTLEKVRRMLGFKTQKLESETIADITIIIGEDNKNTSQF